MSQSTSAGGLPDRTTLIQCQNIASSAARDAGDCFAALADVGLYRARMLDRPQSECEKGVAATLQSRLYGGRMDELPYSRNRRGVRKVVRGRQVLPQQILCCPDSSFK